MNSLNDYYQSLLSVGNEVFIWRNRQHDWGTIDKVSDKWVHIKGIHKTRDKWVLRSDITSVSDATKPVIFTSQMY
jgi:hypothetical protein